MQNIQKQNERVIAFYKMLLGEAGVDYATNNLELAKENIDLYFKNMEGSITELEMIIFKGRYGLDHEPRSLDELIAELSLTRERIRQISEKTIRKLKHPSRARIGFALLLGEKPIETKEEVLMPYVINSIFIDDLLFFSVRTKTVLKRGNINTLNDLIYSNEDYLISIGIGKKSMGEIQKFLAESGLKFKGEK